MRGWANRTRWRREASSTSIDVGKGLRGLVLLLAAAVPMACGDGLVTPGSAAGGSDSEEIVLPLRVHVVDVRGFPGLNASPLSDGEIDDIVAELDRIWAQGNIDWELRELFRESTDPTQSFLDMVTGDAPLSGEVIRANLPSENKAEGAWDVFLLSNLGALGIAGVYLGEGWVISTLSEDGFSVDPDGFAGRVLAHELGHSLGLAHVACTSAGNLMAPGCTSGDRTRLTDDQIRAARGQAATEAPF